MNIEKSEPSVEPTSTPDNREHTFVRQPVAAPASRRRQSSTDMLDDHASPTLKSLIVCETIKWGSLALVLFVIVSFVRPLWSSFYAIVLAPEYETTDQDPSPLTTIP